MTCSTPTVAPTAATTTRWVTATVLRVLADMVMREGDWFLAGQLATWTACMLTTEQRVHATTRLCALGFIKHKVSVDAGARVDHYTVTADGAAAIQAAADGHVRKSGPKTTRAANPVRADALTTRLWSLVRLRKIIDSDEAARTLCDAGDQDFERVRATVRKTLRRWELAEALAAGSRLIKRRDAPASSNGNKRYVLVRDSVEPPRWRQAAKQGAAK